MANNKRSGSPRALQPFPSRTPRRTPPYIPILDSAAGLNRALDQAVNELNRLKNLGFFAGDAFLKTCWLFIEELRNWAMADLTQELLERAEYDYGHWGVRRFRWEESFRDPEDLLKQAERLKKKRDEQAAKKKQMKRSKGSRQ